MVVHLAHCTLFTTMYPIVRAARHSVEEFLRLKTGARTSRKLACAERTKAANSNWTIAYIYIDRFTVCHTVSEVSTEVCYSLALLLLACFLWLSLSALLSLAGSLRLCISLHSTFFTLHPPFCILHLASSLCKRRVGRPPFCALARHWSPHWLPSSPISFSLLVQFICTSLALASGCTSAARKAFFCRLLSIPDVPDELFLPVPLASSRWPPVQNLHTAQKNLLAQS